MAINTFPVATTSVVTAPAATTGYAMITHGYASTGRYIVPNHPAGNCYLAGNSTQLRYISGDGTNVGIGTAQYVTLYQFPVTAQTNSIITHQNWATGPTGITGSNWVGQINGYLFSLKGDSTIWRGTTSDNLTQIGTTPASFIAMAYGNSLFVAISSSQVYTSPDAVTWTARTTAATLLGGSGTPAFTDITFGNGIFFMGGRVYSGAWGVQGHSSTDGISWTSRLNSNWNNIWTGTVRWNGSQFAYIATGGSGDTTYVGAYGYSANGTTWTYVQTYAQSVGLSWNGTNWLSASGSYFLTINTTGSVTASQPHAQGTILGNAFTGTWTYNTFAYANGTAIISGVWSGGSYSNPTLTLYSTNFSTWKWGCGSPSKSCVYVNNKYVAPSAVSTDMYGGVPLAFQFAGDVVQTLN
jgi:hypothetical protein